MLWAGFVLLAIGLFAIEDARAQARGEPVTFWDIARFAVFNTPLPGGATI